MQFIEEEDIKPDLELFEECAKLLLRSSGFRLNEENLSRGLVVTFARGSCGAISSAVVEVNGSTVLGRAYILFRRSVKGTSYPMNMQDLRLNHPRVYIEDEDHRLVKIRRDSPKILILCRLIARSCEVASRNSGGVFWTKAYDSLEFRDGYRGQVLCDTYDCKKSETGRYDTYDSKKHET